MKFYKTAASSSEQGSAVFPRTKSLMLPFSFAGFFMYDLFKCWHNEEVLRSVTNVYDMLSKNV